MVVYMIVCEDCGEEWPGSMEGEACPACDSTNTTLGDPIEENDYWEDSDDGN